MIERTQRRLRQARFFYQHLLNEHQQTTFRHDPEAFEFYFSAFIQAARSITWTLGNEQADKWKAWKPNWEANRTPEEQKLLDLTNKLRIDEEKRGGASLTKEEEEEEVAIEELLNLGRRRQHPAYRPYLYTPLGMQEAQPKTLRHAYYFTDKEGKKEITALCQRYLNFLEKTVRDFCEDNR
jgi:hypothetical protein